MSSGSYPKPSLARVQPRRAAIEFFFERDWKKYFPEQGRGDDRKGAVHEVAKRLLCKQGLKGQEKWFASASWFAKLLPRKTPLASHSYSELKGTRDLVDRRFLERVAEGFGVSLAEIAYLEQKNLPIVGREQELEILTRWWNTQSTSLAVLSGLGGEGKSALIGQWVALLQARTNTDSRVPLVFRWDFSLNPSEHDCLVRLLKNFGSPRTDEPTETELGHAVIQLLQKPSRSRRLLILFEGFETLMTTQEANGPTIATPLMRDVIARLARTSPPTNSMLVITSRLPLVDLPTATETVKSLELKPLDPIPAEDLFYRTLKNGSTPAQETNVSADWVRRFVEKSGGHAFTIILAAAALAERGVTTFDLEAPEANVETKSLHVKVTGRQSSLPAYVLSHVFTALKPVEYEFMQLVSLSAAPVDRALVTEVIKAPNTPTVHLRAWGEARVDQECVPALVKLKLLIPCKTRGEHTAHQLVRDYFADDTRLSTEERTSLHAICYTRCLRSSRSYSSAWSSQKLALTARAAHHAREGGCLNSAVGDLSLANLSPDISEQGSPVQHYPSAVLDIIRPFFTDDSWSSFCSAGEDPLLRGNRLLLATLATRCWQQVSNYGSRFVESCLHLQEELLRWANDTIAPSQLTHAASLAQLCSVMNETDRVLSK